MSIGMKNKESLRLLIVYFQYSSSLGLKGRSKTQILTTQISLSHSTTSLLKWIQFFLVEKSASTNFFNSQKQSFQPHNVEITLTNLRNQRLSKEYWFTKRKSSSNDNGERK